MVKVPGTSQSKARALRASNVSTWSSGEFIDLPVTSVPANEPVPAVAVDIYRAGVSDRAYAWDHVGKFIDMVPEEDGRVQLRFRASSLYFEAGIYEAVFTVGLSLAVHRRVFEVAAPRGAVLSLLKPFRMERLSSSEFSQPAQPASSSIGPYAEAVTRGFKGSYEDWLETLRGPQGLPGTAGASTDSLGDFVTGETIAGPAMVRFVSTVGGLRVMAADAALGFPAQAGINRSVVPGEIVPVKGSGASLTGYSGLAESVTLYCGSAGAVTPVVPVTGVRQKAGVALSASRLLLQIGEPIELA
jgi:hypothetical protein